MRSHLVLAGTAGILGGLAWLLKSGAILIAGHQPPYVFEVGPPLFLMGTWGLLGLTWARKTLPVYTLAVLLFASLAFAIRGVLLVVSDARGGALALLPVVGLFVALIMAGVLMRRQKSLAPPLHRLPLLMGLLTVPLLALSGWLGAHLGPAAEERLVEIPLLLFGLGWIVVGLALMRVGLRDGPTEP